MLVNLSEDKTKTKGFIGPFKWKGWDVLVIWHI